MGSAMGECAECLVVAALAATGNGDRTGPDAAVGPPGAAARINGGGVEAVAATAVDASVALGAGVAGRGAGGTEADGDAGVGVSVRGTGGVVAGCVGASVAADACAAAARRGGTEAGLVAAGGTTVAEAPAWPGAAGAPAESPGVAVRGARLRGFGVCAVASAAVVWSLAAAAAGLRGVRGFGGGLGNVASASAGLLRLRGFAAGCGIPSPSLPGASVFLLIARV